MKYISFLSIPFFQPIYPFTTSFPSKYSRCSYPILQHSQSPKRFKHSIFSTLDLTLYLITDSHLVPHKHLPSVVERAIQGGVTIVQLREKNASVGDIVNIGEGIKKVTDKYKVPLIINDCIEAAILLKADGVHIGQEDMCFEKARKLLGNDKIIGMSCGNKKEANIALEYDVDYIGVGAIYKTGTKKDAGPPIGLHGLENVVHVFGERNKVVGIGGVGVEQAREVGKIGVGGVAVISAIMGKENPELQARILKKRFLQGRNEFFSRAKV